MFTVPGIGSRGPREVSKALLSSIIQPRMEEIFSLVSKEIKRSDFGELLGAGVVITGGGCMTEDTVTLAEEIFGLPVSVGFPKGFNGLVNAASTPMLATGVGLVLYGMECKDEMAKVVGEDENGLFGRIFQWMRHFVEDYF